MRALLRILLLSALPIAAAAQQITDVSPDTGRYTGHEMVEIRGSNFRPTCGIATCFPETVFFGAEQVEVLSWTDAVITVRTPAHRISSVDVTVTARNGHS